ncbi:MAG: GTP-binding protein, partial [bacterium]|nr:GTP-binding protein [bacterium]
WVTRGVYKILNNNGLMNAGGVLKLAQLGRILKSDEGYPKERRLFIAGMMRKFELCFDFPEGDGRLLVPELLSKKEPDLGWDKEDALRFEYHYAVLPEGVLPRFITRSHQHLTAKPTYWRSGVLLEIDGNKVLVRADTQAGRVYIAVQGPPQGRRRALAAIRAELTAIHRTVPGLEATAMAPLPRDPGKVEEYEHLLRLEAEGVEVHYPSGVKKPYRVRELLDGIEEPDQRRVASEV